MRRRMSYDDDEDLDALRLAALQTLNHSRKSNPIQVVESVPHHKPRYEEIYAFGGSGSNGWPYVAPPTDVQLSPRSAAFVQQNTSILRRRKGDKSPSASPPYKSTLATPWEPGSRSPSPPSPKRFYSPRRSVSPAVEFRNRRRTRSRTPIRRVPSPRFTGRSRNNSPRPVRSRRQSPRVSPPVRSIRKASRSPVRVTRHRSQSPVKRKSPVRKPRRAPVRRRTPERHTAKYKNDRRPRNPPREVKEDKKPASPRPRKRSRSRSADKKPEKEASPEKVEEQKVAEKEESPRVEKEESEAEIEVDGIDLFASEESESENEGRFKSSSKSERSAQATVSFSKLVTEPVASLTELKDLPQLASVAQRDRRPERSSVREYSRSRRKRDRDRRSNRHRDAKGKDADKGLKSKSHTESNMKMFKSTFQAVVVNETKKQANDSSSAVQSEKGSKDGDKRKVIQIKRPVSFRETKDKGDSEAQPNGQSSSSGSGGGAGGDGKVKKSIHLRLGGYATPTEEPASSSLASVLAATSKSLKSGNLASLKKSWKTSEKVSMKYSLMILSS